MLGDFTADTTGKRVVMDPPGLYGAAALQTHAVRGQGWQLLPQDPESELRPAQNTDNIPPMMLRFQAAPLNPQRGLIGRITSRYTFLPVGKANQAPQSSA